MIGTSFLILNY